MARPAQRTFSVPRAGLWIAAISLSFSVLLRGSRVPDGSVRRQVFPGDRGAVNSLRGLVGAAEGSHQGGWLEEWLAADVPAVALEFCDEDRGHLAEGLGTL